MKYYKYCDVEDIAGIEESYALTTLVDTHYEYNAVEDVTTSTILEGFINDIIENSQPFRKILTKEELILKNYLSNFFDVVKNYTQDEFDDLLDDQDQQDGFEYIDNIAEVKQAISKNIQYITSEIKDLQIEYLTNHIKEL